MRRLDVSSKLELSHPFAQLGEGGSVSDQGDVIGALHQCDLGRRFIHPTPRRYGRCIHELRATRFLAEAVKNEKAYALFDADAARCNAAVAEHSRDERVWALVLFPRADIGRELGELARSRLLELWTDVREGPPDRQHHAEGALAQPPLHAGEIEEARAWLDEHRVDLLLCHQPARFLDSPPPLILGDWRDALGHRL